MRSKKFLFLMSSILILLSCERKEEQKAEVVVKEEKKEEVKGPVALAEKKGCFACHDIEKKKVGPSYVEVARRYKDDPEAVNKLVKSILKGSMGKWGSIPMSPQPVSEEEAKELAEWILSLR